jgi:hypothetical protein
VSILFFFFGLRISFLWCWFIVPLAFHLKHEFISVQTLLHGRVIYSQLWLQYFHVKTSVTLRFTCSDVMLHSIYGYFLCLNVIKFTKSTLFITISDEPVVQFSIIIILTMFGYLPANSTWYGGQEPRCFWDYIRVACQRVPHNCLASVEALELPHTPLGKVSLI